MPETESISRLPKTGRLRVISVHLLLIAAYVASGRLGLELAVPPGYATAIFPPAGIAAAAALIGGPTMLPSVSLGSLLLNIWVAHTVAGAALPAAFAAAAVIATASTLQAAIVSAALRRLIGYPMALDNGHHLLWFLALAPACCLTSATLSLTGLVALAAVPPSAVMVNWVTWWVGDTLGVLVVLPPLMVLAGEPRALWRRRAAPMALPMLAFFVFFVAVFIRVSAWENNQALLEFKLLSQQAADRIRTRLEEQEIVLGQLQSAFGHAAPVSRDVFAELVHGVLQRFPAIRAVGWAPRVTAADRGSFEAAQRAISPAFRIESIAPAGSLQPAASEQEYYPVTLVEPRQANRWALGLDLMSDVKRHPAVVKALASDAVVATAPLPVTQEPGGPGGLLLLLPVSKGGNGPGLVLVKLSLGALIRYEAPALSGSLSLRLVDLASGEALYDGFPTLSQRVDYRQEFEFGQRRYELQAAPSPTYLKQHRGWQSWALLAVGVLGTGLLGALLMLGTGYTDRIERQVEARTRELAAANRLLQIEIDERRQAEAALRHAQRMEAIGQLTGGIAHDFNNLLTIISANGELLRNAATDEAGLRRANGILRAAERGERMTRQLLAFSRRSTLRPEVVDLRQRTAEMADMLAQSMREDIRVVVELPEDLWQVTIDPAEFELAVLNIAVNARDAMPHGGRLHVAARNVTAAANELAAGAPAGEFVALTLADTGTGMPPEVLARAFEPYFTTKEVGAGSGLGLSQVYGFATQSGGHATIASWPDAGTTVTLYLPRAVAAASPAAAAATPATGLAMAKLLVVEDEAEIGDLTVSMLRELGHQAMHVRNVAAALATLAEDDQIRMVISDIVLPGETNGLDLARIVRAQYPGLPLLLVTGYSRSAQEAASEGFALLRKPYRRDSLNDAIHVAVDGRAQRSSDRSDPVAD